MTRVSAAVRNAGLTMQVGVAAPVSWIVPEPFWLPLTRTIGRLEARWRLPGLGAASLPFDDNLARSVGWSPGSIAAERIATGHASRLYALREYAPWRRHVPVRISGAEHITQALDGHAGAILWIGRFTFASIITKIGLHQGGFPVSHVSRPTHGFGTSPFAVRRLNRIWTRIEERFLRERIVLEAGSETGALRTVRRRLADNGLISITVGSEGSRTVEVVLLGHPLRLATGPVSLATASGALLLPVFTVREDSGQFRIEIDASLHVPQDGARERREQVVAEEYAGRLEPWIRRYPGQWLG
jgi:lauroyl/myristoyl acyltransferase